MNYRKVCLFCGRQNNSTNYHCSCINEEWTSQYRTLDVEIDFQHDYGSLLKSFKEYSFDNPKGILQYSGLPIKNIPSDNLDRAGLTPLYKLRYLSNKYNSTIYLKDEGCNPSGCFKDREVLLCLLNSFQNNYNKAVIFSSGNAAASAATLVNDLEYDVLTFLAGDTYPEKIDHITNHGSDVVKIGDDQTNFETGYRLYSKLMADNVFTHDDYDNWAIVNPFRIQGDKTLALEIIKQLSADEGETIVVPDYVLVPTANGSLLTGIWKGFKELKQMSILSKLPKMISLGITNANPVCRAVKNGETSRPVRCDRSKIDSGDAEAGSTMIVEEGYDSIEAAKAVIQSGGSAIELHSSAIRETLIDFLDIEEELAINENLLPEPASLASLAAAKQVTEELSLSTSDIMVAVSTGHGFKAINKINKMLTDRIDLQYMVNHIATGRKNEIGNPGNKKGEIIQIEATEEEIFHSFSQLTRTRV